MPAFFCHSDRRKSRKEDEGDSSKCFGTNTACIGKNYENAISNNDLGKTQKIVIRDSALIALPNTGGAGIWKYALIVTGFAAGFTAVTIASGKRKKKAA